MHTNRIHSIGVHLLVVTLIWERYNRRGICKQTLVFMLSYISYVVYELVENARIYIRKSDRILHKKDTEMYIWVVHIAASFINSEQVWITEGAYWILVSWEICALTKCLLIYQCLWRGLGGGGGRFWLLNESLTFKGTDA